MNIRLIRMILKNFKGIRDFLLDTSGENINVLGENGSGKTTLYDAFLWVLFDKDSGNRTNFDIKTMNDTGEALHNLEHEVELLLDIDGVQVMLKKQLKEKWTKKRGESEETLTGHETFYWIDEVPVKAGEFKARINGLIDENIFRLLTNPFYFNQGLTPQDRRKMLMDICGDMTDQQVIETSEKLAPLTSILSNRSIDDYRLVLSDKSKKLNAERDVIPGRIDEVRRSIPTENIDFSEVGNQLSTAKAELAAKEEAFNPAKEAFQKYQMKLTRAGEINMRLLDREKALTHIANAEFRKAQNRIVEVASELEGNKQRIKLIETRVDTEMKIHAEAERKLEDLRGKYDQHKASTFNEPTRDLGVENFKCPTCGQAIQGDALTEKIEQMKMKFEQDKRNELNTIKIQGQGLAVENGARMAEIDKMKAELTKLETQCLQLESELAELKELPHEPQEVDFSTDKEWQSLTAEKEELTSENESLQPVTSMDELKEIHDLKEEIAHLQATLAKRDMVESAKSRIDELKNREKQLTAQINELDKHKDLLDTFVSTKVRLLEDKINGCFGHVKFRLFEPVLSGGVKEKCDTMVNGVPWDSVNHAGKVNAGLDIINTLAEKYGVHAPIFIDFRESVTSIIPTQSQVINLIKTTGQKTLKIEKEA